jgi:hypothetical protein
MSWPLPTFIEIDMSAEIGSYQDDFDPPAEPAFITQKGVEPRETAAARTDEVAC